MVDLKIGFESRSLIGQSILFTFLIGQICETPLLTNKNNQFQIILLKKDDSALIRLKKLSFHPPQTCPFSNTSNHFTPVSPPTPSHKKRSPSACP